MLKVVIVRRYVGDLLGPFQEHISGHPDADSRRGSRRDAPLPPSKRPSRHQEDTYDTNNGAHFSQGDEIIMVGGYLIAVSQIPHTTESAAIDVCEARIIADPGGSLAADDPIYYVRANIEYGRIRKNYRKNTAFGARELLSNFGSEEDLPFMLPVED